jgi:hypothetical protein
MVAVRPLFLAMQRRTLNMGDCHALLGSARNDSWEFPFPYCHREERSDDAISPLTQRL